MLNFTRQLLARRRLMPALADGDIRLLDAPDEIVACTRTDQSGSVLCAFNLSDRDVGWSPGEELGRNVIVASEREVGSMQHVPLVMPPMSGYWAVPAAGGD